MPRKTKAAPGDDLPHDGVATVRLMVAEAVPHVLKPTPSAEATSAPPEKKAGKKPLMSGKPGDWRGKGQPLPPDCPVTPLGLSGPTAWFIDPIGQIQSFDPPYGKGHLLGLFLGHADYLTWAWPRYGKDGNIDGYKAEVAAADLIAACKLKGPWSAIDKIRGRGAWRLDDGRVIYHAGVNLCLDGDTLSPGDFDGYVYPTRPPVALPFPTFIEARKNPAALLLSLFRTWSWARPVVDPTLLLGWIGAASIAGALPWRPAAFITGDKATGKSTLQSVIKQLFGEALIQAADTTAAGVYQRVGQDCLPVSVDELEGEADVRKQKAVLKLARLAASGALMLRGGDNHQGTEFQARSAFIFSSINTPPLEPQDLSRMAILRLHRLPDGVQPPALDPQALAVAGRCILRRMLDEWGRFSETYAAFRGAMAAAGMDGRGQDTFGTLLTCADMIAHEGWCESRLQVDGGDGDLTPWADLMAVGRMHEFEDASENWRLCLSHMLSTPVEAWRNGTKTSVGQVLHEYWNKTDDMGASAAKQLLSKAGLTLVRHNGSLTEDWLAVPNQCALTRVLFDGSKWAGDMGAGVWAGALRQSPPTVHAVDRCLVNGTRFRATLISLEALYGEGGVMTERGQ